MSTLLLRLAAPLQSWGTDSKFETRRTQREPSKSGVIGLLAAALGWRRDADLSRLTALRFGVRVDRNGELLKDFHTAKSRKTSYITYRYYLSDAIFLVGLESEDEDFLYELKAALELPCFPLFLGKRSCPPTLPLVLEICNKDLETALREKENLNTNQKSVRNSKRYLRIDCRSSERGSAVLQDLPISFSPLKRQFGFRTAKEVWLKEDMGEDMDKEHDPMAELD